MTVSSPADKPLGKLYRGPSLILVILEKPALVSPRLFFNLFAPLSAVRTVNCELKAPPLLNALLLDKGIHTEHLHTVSHLYQTECRHTCIHVPTLPSTTLHPSSQVSHVDREIAPRLPVSPAETRLNVLQRSGGALLPSSLTGSLDFVAGYISFPAVSVAISV